jgi:hypothetical protein
MRTTAAFIMLLGWTLSPDALARQAPLFSADAPMEAVLVTDLHAVLHDARNDSTEYPALLRLFGTSDTVEIPLKVRIRGNYRRRPENCDFPPIRLNFATRRVENTPFEGQDKLKLVTHCRDTVAAYEENTVIEFLLYRTYNLLTDQSFRVRLLNLTYVDERGNRPDLQKPAFIIENAELLAERLQGHLDNSPETPEKQCEPSARDRVYLFEYLIGNIDWDIGGGHNMARLRIGDTLFPVPYDFDFAGLVDPGYADRLPRIDLGTPRNSVFRYFCRQADEFDSAIELFLDKESDIRLLFETEERLSRRRRTDISRKLDRFFRIIRDPVLKEREFVRPCRNR